MKMNKERDPNWKNMIELRRSNASGAHSENKYNRKVKHKKKEIEEQEKE